MKEILQTEKRDGIPCVIIFPSFIIAGYVWEILGRRRDLFATFSPPNIENRVQVRPILYSF